MSVARSTFNKPSQRLVSSYLSTMRSSRLIWLLVVGVDEASSLKDEAMAKIKKDAGFDPKEPPEHNTDIKVWAKG